MRRLLILLALLIPAVLHAQAPVVTPPVTGITIVISGGVSPVTNTIPIASFTSITSCPAPPSTALNPTTVIYQVNSTDTNCWRYTDTGGGPLTALPIGGTTYTATITYTNANGNGPVSNVSNPFSRPGALPTTAPVGLQVR